MAEAAAIRRGEQVPAGRFAVEHGGALPSEIWSAHQPTGFAESCAVAPELCVYGALCAFDAKLSRDAQQGTHDGFARAGELRGASRVGESRAERRPAFYAMMSGIIFEDSHDDAVLHAQLLALETHDADVVAAGELELLDRVVEFAMTLRAALRAAATIASMLVGSKTISLNPAASGCLRPRNRSQNCCARFKALEYGNGLPDPTVQPPSRQSASIPNPDRSGKVRQSEPAPSAEAFGQSFAMATELIFRRSRKFAGFQVVTSRISSCFTLPAAGKRAATVSSKSPVEAVADAARPLAVGDCARRSHVPWDVSGAPHDKEKPLDEPGSTHQGIE